MHDSSINGHIGVGRTGHQGRVSAPVVGECGPKRDLQQEAGGAQCKHHATHARCHKAGVGVGVGGGGNGLRSAGAAAVGGLKKEPRTTWCQQRVVQYGVKVALLSLGSRTRKFARVFALFLESLPILSPQPSKGFGAIQARIPR